MLNQDKIDYISFVKDNKERVPIYFHPEWLDAVCGNLWTALVYKNKANKAQSTAIQTQRTVKGTAKAVSNDIKV